MRDARYMTYPSNDPSVQVLEERAERAESSPIPVFLKIGRVLVWIIYAIVLVTAFLLLLAFFLRLAGANPGSSFVDWVYRNADRAMEPFRGIFPDHELDGNSVVDTSLLFATVFYFVFALLIDVVLRWITHLVQRKEREAADLRNQADYAAQQAYARQQAADQAAHVAAHDAAAREYAAQQAAAQQYAIAQAAAREALAQQQVPSQPVRAKPATPAGEPMVQPPSAPVATTAPAAPAPASPTPPTNPPPG